MNAYLKLLGKLAMKQEKLAMFSKKAASFSLLFNGTMHFSSRRNKKDFNKVAASVLLSVQGYIGRKFFVCPFSETVRGKVSSI